MRGYVHHLAWAAAGLIVSATAPALGGFEDGLRAFDGGDYASAAREWRELAAGCDPQAATALAGLYRDGLGVPRDERLSVRWYTFAAEAGEPVAQMTLGELYAEGRAVVRDPVQAYLWLSLAARQGKTWAADRVKELDQSLSPAERRQAQALFASFRPAARRRCG